MHEPTFTRRSVLTAGLGAGAALAAGASPAWARRHQSRRHRRPRPGIPPEIDTVVVLMFENHSFDNILGMLPHQVHKRRNVDGLPGFHGVVTASNPDAQGVPVRAFHLPDTCPAHGLTQNWNSSHKQWDNGLNDGFVRNVNNPTPMGYFDQSDLPVTYALASSFALSDRYFCSVLAQTYPNRRFLFTGTASGTIATDATTFTIPAPNGTIFDRLDAAGRTWRVYYRNAPSPLIVPNFLNNPAQVARCVSYSEFASDARAGTLPNFSLVDPQYNYESEENPQDVTYGENFLYETVAAVFDSPRWRNTVLFVTYDEHGGYYDHVPPPPAVKPDSTPPKLSAGDVPGAYDRYGFRVPLIVISPWSRPDYVSRAVADHASILAFIERQWALAPLTARDAAAWDLSDMFDVHRPHFLDPPAIPAPPSIDASLARCRANGENPPTATP